MPIYLINLNPIIFFKADLIYKISVQLYFKVNLFDKFQSYYSLMKIYLINFNPITF